MTERNTRMLTQSLVAAINRKYLETGFNPANTDRSLHGMSCDKSFPSPDQAPNSPDHVS